VHVRDVEMVFWVTHEIGRALMEAVKVVAVGSSAKVQTTAALVEEAHAALIVAT
jgi:hypothetical protein